MGSKKTSKPDSEATESQPGEQRAGPPEPQQSAPDNGTNQPKNPNPPLFDLFSLDASTATNDQISEIVNRHVKFEIEKTGLLTTYTVLVLYDDHRLTPNAANRIYQALTGADAGKPILLVLNSDGGEVAAAYLIAKLCREHTSNAFEVSVPRRAKSAATLICCGADKIHMGSLSELGPIDPQLDGLPLLALKQSVEHIAQLAGKYPSASGMFSDYLTKSLRIEALGYFERVAESSVQYAVRVLQARITNPKERNNEEIANHLVYSFKDHGFVIDSREAAQIFGNEIIVCNSQEYQLANSLFLSLSFIGFVCGSTFSREFSYIGNHESGCLLWKKSDT